MIFSVVRWVAAQPVIAVMALSKPNASYASVMALMARDLPAPGKCNVFVFLNYKLFCERGRKSSCTCVYCEVYNYRNHYSASVVFSEMERTCGLHNFLKVETRVSVKTRRRKNIGWTMK